MGARLRAASSDGSARMWTGQEEQWGQNDSALVTLFFLAVGEKEKPTVARCLHWYCGTAWQLSVLMPLGCGRIRLSHCSSCREHRVEPCQSDGAG